MLIDIGNGVMWDDSLAYREQDQSAIAVVDIVMQCAGDKVLNAVCGRCERETWLRNGYAIVADYYYLNSVMHRACYALSNQVITVNKR